MYKIKNLDDVTDQMLVDIMNLAIQKAHSKGYLVGMCVVINQAAVELVQPTAGTFIHFTSLMDRFIMPHLYEFKPTVTNSMGYWWDFDTYGSVKRREALEAVRKTFITRLNTKQKPSFITTILNLFK